MSFGALFGLIVWSMANVFLGSVVLAFGHMVSESEDGLEGCAALLLGTISLIVFAASVAGEIAVYSG